MSVMQLRDQTDELQSEVEHREKTGDVRGAELYQQKLNRAQQQLMEKNKLRSVRFSVALFCLIFVITFYSASASA